MSADETTPPNESTKQPSAPPPADPPAAPAEPTNGAATAAAEQPTPAKKGGKKKDKDVEVAIRLTKVTKKFGVKAAVDGLSLKIKAGSVYGLIGPNGAGKTTTFSMLAGFLEPTEGAVEILGYPPTHIDELRSRVGVLPQDAVLPPTDKVGQFLLHMGRLQDIPRDRLEESARAVLEEVDGREWWDMRCSALSHGMAKRVQLAQALLGDPEVVLLDEPTAGLDPRVAYDVRTIIKNRKGRCTLVVSSHNLQELEEICDAAAILDRGRVVASGTMSSLTASNQEIRVKIAPPLVVDGAAYRRAASTIPMEALRAIPNLQTVEFDEESSELIVTFDRKAVDAETVIGQVLWACLNAQVRISAVTKGRGLEQRVMELT